MERMKTFFKYFLWIVGFFIVTLIIQFIAFYTMYGSIKDNGKVESTSDIVLDVSKIKATNVNGFINLKVTNNGTNDIQEKYIKIDLYNSQDLLAATKYVKIAEINQNESYNYKVTFKANNIESYNISVVNEAPEEEHTIISILGLDVDVDNLVMSAKETSKNLPDIAYAIVGIYLTIETGKWLWALYLLM